MTRFARLRAPATDVVGPLARAHRVLRLSKGDCSFMRLRWPKPMRCSHKRMLDRLVLTDRTAEHDAFARIGRRIFQNVHPEPDLCRSDDNPLGVPSVQQDLEARRRAKVNMCVVSRTTSGSVTPKQERCAPRISGRSIRAFRSSVPKPTTGCSPKMLICTAELAAAP